MNKINWEIIDLQMKKIKFPLCFLNNLFKINDKFTDNQLVITLRFFFKYNYNCLTNYNLKILLVLLDKNKFLSRNLINELYKIIKTKILITNMIKNFKLSYNSNKFWELNLNDQINKLVFLKMRFYSNFDVCKSNTFFFNKIYTLTKNKNHTDFHTNQLLLRLRNVYQLFGKPFFTNYNIITIKKSKFNKSDIETKIKYSKYIFQKINKIMCKIIDSFILFKHIQTKIDNILNPNPIDFKIDTFDSETDLEDLLFMIEN
jgi:hypothetical protein